MKREKSIQIPETVFFDIIKYFLLDQRSEETEKNIVRGISEKVDAIVNHDLYTKYKTAPTPEQQEKARQEYLDRKGITSDFRW